ncbi:hypothetical protein GQ457_11G030270 [Hibiscus cannabinus]
MARNSIRTIKQASKHQEKTNRRFLQALGLWSKAQSRGLTPYWEDPGKLDHLSNQLVSWLAIQVLLEFHTSNGATKWSFSLKPSILDLWEIFEERFVEGPKKKKSSKGTGKAKLNAKAIHTLFCGLNDDVSKNVSSCKSAKEMWEKLEKLYKKKEIKFAKIDP